MILDFPSAISLIAYGGGTGIGIAAGFAFVKWMATFTAGRWDAKEAQIDKSTGALIGRLEKQIETLAGDCNDFRHRLGKAETSLLECKRQHAESQAEVMQLKAMLQGYGDAREKAQLIVSAEKHKDRK